MQIEWKISVSMLSTPADSPELIQSFLKALNSETAWQHGINKKQVCGTFVVQLTQTFSVQIF